MLSEYQKSKLEPLTHDKRYGKLLLSAMKTWEESNPHRGTFGVVDYKYNHDGSLEIENLDYFILDENHNCCLIGASLLGKKSCSGFSSALEEEYGLSFAEKIAIIDGFDAPNNVSTHSDYDAFLFAKSVSEIIFGISKWVWEPQSADTSECYVDANGNFVVTKTTKRVIIYGSAEHQTMMQANFENKLAK